MNATNAMTVAASQGHQKPSWIESSTWIYCVKCRTHRGSEAGGGRSPYFVTDCGHIYCSQCRAIAESSQCFMCQRKGLKFLEVTDGIKSHPQVGVFFQNLADMCSQLSNLFRFHQRHKTLSKQFLHENGTDEASLVAQFGSLAMAPIGQLEKKNSESAKRRKLTLQKQRAICSEKNQQLMEIEAIVMKLKSLRYREEDILSIHVQGNPVPSVKTICETRTALQYAAKVLNGGGRPQPSTTTSGSNNTRQTSTSTGVMQAGGIRRTDGGLSGVQSAHNGGQFSVAEMVTPQRQQLSHGSAAQTVTPYQFGLTPFQRVGTPSAQCSISTPTGTAIPAMKKMLAPPPPPPAFPPHLSQGPPATPVMTSNQGCSPLSWHTPTRADGMPPPRLPPSRRGQAQGDPLLAHLGPMCITTTGSSQSPSPQFTSQQTGRQFSGGQSMLTPQRQQQLLTPQQTNAPGPSRASPSPVRLQPNLSSPSAASGVATGSAVGLQLTPTQCTTPTNQLIRNTTHHSSQTMNTGITKVTPSPVEMMTPKSTQSNLSRPRTPMSVQSASPSSPLGTPGPMGTSTPTNMGRVSIRGPPSGGRMGHVTTKGLTPEGTPQALQKHLCTSQRSCYSTPPMSHGRQSSGGSRHSSGGRRGGQTHYSIVMNS